LRDGPLSPNEIAGATGQPLFRVRSGLRELMEAGYVEMDEDRYRLSDRAETTWSENFKTSTASFRFFSHGKPHHRN